MEFDFYNDDVYDFSRDIYMLEWLDGIWHRGSLHLFKEICVLAVSSV